MVYRQIITLYFIRLTTEPKVILEGLISVSQGFLFIILTFLRNVSYNHLHLQPSFCELKLKKQERKQIL